MRHILSSGKQQEISTYILIKKKERKKESNSCKLEFEYEETKRAQQFMCNGWLWHP